MHWSLINPFPSVNEESQKAQQLYLKQLAQQYKQFNPEVKYFEQLSTFIYLCVSTIRPALSISDKGGKGVISHSHIFPNDFAFTETLLQHYGFSTTVLDVSRDPKIALWFAFNPHATKYQNSPFYNRPSEMVLYCYQQNDQNDRAKVKITGPDSNIENPRARAQKGHFLAMPDATYFYLVHDRYPSIEDYDHDSTFELTKYIITLDQEVFDFCSTLFKEHAINEENLYQYT